MKYYAMYQDKRIFYQVILKDFPTDQSVSFQKSDSDRLSENTMLYTVEDNNSVYVDMLEAPVCMVTEEVGKVLTMYDPTVITKRVFLVNQEKKSRRKYQLILLDRIDCLHEDSEFYPDHSVKRLILDQKKVREKEIFQIQGISRNTVIVSMNIAESILRRDVYGIRFEEIECR